MIINKEQLKEFFILFTYSNLRYERYLKAVELSDIKKIFNNEEIDSDTTTNIIIAVKNHKTLYNQFQDICNKYKGRLSIKLIKEIHSILMKNLYRQELEDANDKPGEFKKSDYIIGLFNVGAKAGEVERQMQELFDEINAVEITEENIYKIVVYLHNWICWIHGFADGNGMIARFMINYLFMVNEFSPVIFAVERKKICEYTTILEKFDDIQGICEMVEFIESYS